MGLMVYDNGSNAIMLRCIEINTIRHVHCKLFEVCFERNHMLIGQTRRSCLKST